MGIGWLIVDAALGFGGGYVSDGVAPTAVGGLVVYAYDDEQTVITYRPQASGGAGDFAFVVPLPTNPGAGAVEVANAEDVRALEAFTAPRLVAYTCEDLHPFGGDTGYIPYYYNPYYYYGYNREYVQTEDFVYGGPFRWNRGRGALYCERGCGSEWYGPYGYYVYPDRPVDTGPTDPAVGGGEIVTWAQRDAAWTATYDASVVPADSRDDVDAWFAARGLVPTAAQHAMLDEYVGPGRAFLVAGVAGDGNGALPPLQVALPGRVTELPLRLGLEQSPGEQDVVLIAVDARSIGRTEVDAWPKVTIADACMLDASDQAEFTAQYDALVARAIRDSAPPEEPDDTDVPVDTDTDAPLDTDTDTALDTDTSTPIDTDTDTDAPLDTDLPEAAAFAGWAVEFRGAADDCEPCPEGPLSSAVLAGLGFTVLPVDLGDVGITRLRLRYTADGPTSDPALITAPANDVALSFVQFVRALESDLPVCEEGFVDDAGECPQARSRANAPDPRRWTRRAGVMGMLLGAGLWIRRRR